MTTFTTQRLTAHYTDEGDGPPVVLLHAGGSSSAQWRKIAPALQNRFRLLAPDLIGFGETGSLPGGIVLSHDRQARLVLDLVAHIADAPVHVVGHSYGGATALRLAIDYPSLVDSLVLIEPIVTPLLREAGEIRLHEELETVARKFFDASGRQDIEDAWRHFIDYRNSEGTWDKLCETARGRFFKQTEQIVEGFRSNLDNPTTIEDLERVAVPTLLLCGEETTAPDRRIAEILWTSIPDCAFGMIPGAEHMSPLTHPEPVAHAVLGFLENDVGDLHA